MTSSPDIDRSDQGILGRIVEARRARIEQAKATRSLEDLRASISGAPPLTDFKNALATKPGISVIAEMKRSSPSAGSLDPDLDPVQRAEMYCSAGAAAISVLTEKDFFGGSNDDLVKVKGVAADHGVAVLQKDFVVDEYQVYEARTAGADAILLIIAILDSSTYSSLLGLAQELGMTALVEVFDEEELEIALSATPDILGVNNRNLKTLETSLNVFERLAPDIPDATLKVAESGMKNADDVARMGRAGAKAVLVGESLMRAGGDAAELVSAMSRVDVSGAST